MEDKISKLKDNKLKILFCTLCIKAEANESLSIDKNIQIIINSVLDTDINYSPAERAELYSYTIVEMNKRNLSLTLYFNNERNKPINR